MNRLIHSERVEHRTICAAVFDFDGTFSTLRHGWESVMKELMLEMISGDVAYKASKELQQEVDNYIDQSTGIQTVFQMEWLMNRVEQEGHGIPERDKWWYKDEYNRRLMLQISQRLSDLENRIIRPEQYLIAGSVEFLKELKKRDIPVYLASGTDHHDVVHEATLLGVNKYVKEIYGAPEHKAACSKEKVIKMILQENQVPGNSLLLVGDGKVEIALGSSVGAFTIGVASDEDKRYGINPVKERKLIEAGADAIIGDFLDKEQILEWIGFGK